MSIKTHLIYLCLIIALPITSNTLAAPLDPPNKDNGLPIVLVTQPSANENIVPLTSNVVLTYGESIISTTIHTGTIVSQGMMGGMLTGTYTVDGPVVTLDPSRPLFPNEIVRTTATDGVITSGGVMSEAYQWQFRAGEVILRCQGTFRLDEAASANLEGISDTGAAWGDYDQDGDLDIALSGSGGTVIYRNDAGVFIAATTTTDITDSDPVWGDYDNDGDLDLLVQGRDKSEIFQNNSGTFTSISANLASGYYRGGDVDWGDYDNDGDLDILVVGIGVLLPGVENQPAIPISVIYENSGGTFIIDTVASAGLTSPSKSHAAWVDYDNDGDLDIFMSSDGSLGSLIYKNDVAAGTFSLDAAATADMAATDVDSAEYVDGNLDFGDYDQDGDLDLLITGDNGNYATRIYENQAGVFITDTVNSAVLDDMQYSDVAWGDYDNDGDLDILLTGNGSSGFDAYVYENQGGSFTLDANAAANLAGARFSSSSWGDYDNDGDLDILITGQAEAPAPIYSQDTSYVYRNEDCTPDVTIAKDVTPRVAQPGQTITYTIDFTNTGTAAATDVVISDIIPVEIQPISFSSPEWVTSIPGTTYSWTVDSLAPGQHGTITITGLVNNGLGAMVITNTASITVTGNLAESELAPDNNQSSVGLRVVNCLAGSNILYVDQDAPGDNNGFNWGDAFTDLQSALDKGYLDACGIDEIWVATGVYTPGVARTDSFGLVDGVGIYGGFAATETLRKQRDWDANITVLSGDIDGNDGTDANGVVTDTANISASSNSYHVITSTNVLSSTVLDGFFITAGDADGSSGPLNRGGGMLNDTSSPTLANLTFSGNSANYTGGGMFSLSSSPMLTNVTFAGNSASSGGGMYNESDSNPTLTNVTFTGNSVNFAGGGMYSLSSSPSLTNVTFAGNTASYQGGGMYNELDSNPAIRNTIFWTNTAGNSGPAIYNNDSSPVLTNTLIQGDCPAGATCNGVLLNNDPLFLRNPDAGDGDWTTPDDNDYGDLRLSVNSPAINQGDNNFVMGVTTDLAGNPRIIDGDVDLGAYECESAVVTNGGATLRYCTIMFTNGFE